MKIKRHNLSIRFVHWFTAMSILVLFFSGFGQMPIYKRYFVDQLPGMGWSSDFYITLNLHYYAAIVLIFVSIYYLTYLIGTRKIDVLPRKGDFKESIQIFAAMVGLAEEPENDKYLAEQRLAFVVTAFSIMALILTGLLKVYKNLPGVEFSTGAVFWLAMIHNIFTVILLLSIIVHLLAFLLKDNRPLVASMFTGVIGQEYIMRRHTKWWEKMQNNAGEEVVPASMADGVEKPVASTLETGGQSIPDAILEEAAGGITPDAAGDELAGESRLAAGPDEAAGEIAADESPTGKAADQVNTCAEGEA